MQIQGELTRDYKKTYSGTMQSAVLIAKEDGLFRSVHRTGNALGINLKYLFSLWRGLNAGLAYQVVMNGTRLTLFDLMKDNGKGFNLSLVKIRTLCRSLYYSWSWLLYNNVWHLYNNSYFLAV